MCCLFLVVYLVILSEGRDVFYKEKTSGPLADVQFEGKVGSGRTTRKAGVGLPEQFHTAPAKSERLFQEEMCNGEQLSKGGCVTETRS